MVYQYGVEVQILVVVGDGYCVFVLFFFVVGGVVVDIDFVQFIVFVYQGNEGYVLLVVDVYQLIEQCWVGFFDFVEEVEVVGCWGQLVDELVFVFLVFFVQGMDQYVVVIVEGFDLMVVFYCCECGRLVGILYIGYDVIFRKGRKLV